MSNRGTDAPVFRYVEKKLQMMNVHSARAKLVSAGPGISGGSSLYSSLSLQVTRSRPLRQKRPEASFPPGSATNHPHQLSNISFRCLYQNRSRQDLPYQLTFPLDKYPRRRDRLASLMSVLASSHRRREFEKPLASR